MNFSILKILLLVLLWISCGELRAEHIFRFGTGGSAGTYFPIGSLIAEAINQKKMLNGNGGTLVVVPQRSSGSAANLSDISAGLIEGGLAQADVVSLAYRGEGEFKGQELDKKLRTVGTLYLESMHLVVSVQSNINGVEDLAGKRVSVDELGSGTQLNIDPVLAAYGMTRGDIMPVYLKSEDAISRMRRGLVDAFFIVAGYPVTGVKQLVDEGVGRVVGLDDRQIEGLVDDYVYFTDHVIPKSVYSNEDEIPTLSVAAQMIVSANVSDDVVYEITKNLWSEDTLRGLAAGHPRGSDINSLKALEGVAVPLHPGALRYYEEKGYDFSELVK